MRQAVAVEVPVALPWPALVQRHFFGQGMADAHGDTALELALDQFRHQHPAALDPAVVVEYLHFVSALVHLDFDNGRHRAVVGDHGVVQLGVGVGGVLPVEQVVAVAAHLRLLGIHRAIAVLHCHRVEREAFAHAVDDEVGFGPAPAVETVHADAGYQPHVVGLLGQLGERDR